MELFYTIPSLVMVKNPNKLLYLHISGFCWNKSTNELWGFYLVGNTKPNHLDNDLQPGNFTEILSCSWIWFVLAKCNTVFWRLFFTCTWRKIVQVFTVHPIQKRAWTSIYKADKGWTFAHLPHWTEASHNALEALWKSVPLIMITRDSTLPLTGVCRRTIDNSWKCIDQEKEVAGVISYNGFHVGGFNPFEKDARQIGSNWIVSPGRRGLNETCFKPPRFI